MVSSFILLSLLSCALAEVEVNNDGVLVLTEATFDEALASADNILVEFYAPWCGHCKALAPEYAKAAKKLAEAHPDLSVKLGMVDATVESALAKEFGVRGYPTLKFFRGNDRSDPKEYGGGRQADDIVTWIVKKTGPPAIELKDVEGAKKFTEDEEFVVVGYFADKDSDAAKAFISAAEKMDSVKFGIAHDESVKKHFEVDGAAKVFVVRTFDEPKVVYDGALEKDDIEKFIKDNQLPYIIEFSDETAPKIFGGDIKTHSLFFCKKAESESTLADYKKAAIKMKGKAVFIFLDVTQESNSRVLDFFGIKAEDAPQLRVIRMGEGDMEKFKSDTTEFTEAHFGQFVSDVLDGKVKKHMMTEDVPEDWDKEPVKVLVGKNFEQVVMDEGKDVLIEFYAPWCGHCKALAPIYDELGEHYKDNGEVLITKVDATKNEVDLVKVQGFPTIVLVRKGDNKIITYNGGRTFDDLKTFVDSHGETQGEDDEEEEDEGAEEEEGETHDEL